MKIEDAETPVPVIDAARVEANLKKMQDYCTRHGLALRPHIKTHKLPRFAKRQLELGAVGITCQKLGEAEVMADAGCLDILISYPLIGAAKARRLAALARRATMRAAIDNPVALGDDRRRRRRGGRTDRRPRRVRLRPQAHRRRLGRGGPRAGAEGRGQAQPSLRRADDLPVHRPDGGLRRRGQAQPRRGRPLGRDRLRRRHAERLEGARGRGADRASRRHVHLSRPGDSRRRRRQPRRMRAPRPRDGHQPPDRRPRGDRRRLQNAVERPGRSGRRRGLRASSSTIRTR